MAQRTLTSRGRRGESSWPLGLCGGWTVGDWGDRPQKTVAREQLPASSTRGYRASPFLPPPESVLVPCAPGPPPALPLPSEAAQPLLLFCTQSLRPGHRQLSGGDTLASGLSTLRSSSRPRGRGAAGGGCGPGAGLVVIVLGEGCELPPLLVCGARCEPTTRPGGMQTAIPGFPGSRSWPRG